MKIWLTADSHLGHTNILKYCPRPFSSVEEMDVALINNINSVVQSDDTLYHLGDFTFGIQKVKFYRDQIKCQNIVLVRGNHDPHKKNGEPHHVLLDNFQAVHDLYRLRANHNGKELRIILCHYAMRTWNGSHNGSMHLFGHSHGSMPDDPRSLSCDVGVDCHNYMPIDIETIEQIMSKKKFVPVDHHIAE